MDPLLLMVEVDRATDRLLRTATTLDETGVSGPSLLPGWTRGHVLAHLARNADSYVNLLTAARTGEHLPQYTSRAARDADIERGARRTSAVHQVDLRESAARFADAADAMPAEAWAAAVESSRGRRAAAALVWGRLREVEVHHVDLAAGYAPADWPEAFSQRLLHELVADLNERPDVPALVLSPTETARELILGKPAGTTTVSGPAHELAGWLSGRAGGDRLTVDPDAPLPAPPSWI